MASALSSGNFGHPRNFSSSVAVCYSLDWASLNRSVASFASDCCLLLNATNATDQPGKPPGKPEHRPSPSSYETWLIGLLSVSIICASSVLSLAIFPCIRRSTYDLTIKFMVALAVGSLAATGCLFLIPEALGIASLPETDQRFAGYQFKCATICGGIYFFFLGEQVIKKLVLGRQARNHNKKQLRERAISGELTHTAIGDLPLKIVGYTPLDDQAEQNGTMTQRSTEVELITDSSSNNDLNSQGSKVDPSGTKTDSAQDTLGYKYVANGETGLNSTHGSLVAVRETNGYSVGVAPSADDKSKNQSSDKKRPPRRQVQPVAYMILLGDGLHNFIDGLAIGSAYTISVMTGVSVSLAVLCEELPHELGDFAVMVNAGLSKKRAALYNFLCACSIFIGFAIGVLVGDALDGASSYIFAVAAGMFLYISLADMLPELVQDSHGHDHGFPTTDNKSREQSPDGNQEEDLVHKLGGRWLFVVQNVGILTGFSILFILSIYSGELEKALESLAG